MRTIDGERLRWFGYIKEKKVGGGWERRTILELKELYYEADIVGIVEG